MDAIHRFFRSSILRKDLRWVRELGTHMEKHYWFGFQTPPQIK